MSRASPALWAYLAASRLAGTVHLERGAVSATSGKGEELQVRRGVRTLRVDHRWSGDNVEVRVSATDLTGAEGTEEVRS